MSANEEAYEATRRKFSKSTDEKNKLKDAECKRIKMSLQVLQDGVGLTSSSFLNTPKQQRPHSHRESPSPF